MDSGQKSGPVAAKGRFLGSCDHVSIKEMLETVAKFVKE
jgi:hypothetical protein